MLGLTLKCCKKNIMAKEKLSMSSVNQKKAPDRVQRKVLEWAMRKKGIPEAVARTVMTQSEGEKARVRVDCGVVRGV